MGKLLFLFMMFSIVGWLWETPWVSFKDKKFVNRGFLYGPYIPIYGCAVVTIVYSMSIFDNWNNNVWYIVIFQMIYMAVITAVWEFFTSWILEKIFHTRWWDYSSHRFNIQGRISLGVTVFFGLGGYVLWRFVLPPFMSIYNSLDSTQLLVLLVIFYTVFTIDNYFTLKSLFKVRNYMVTLEKITDELKSKLEDTKQATIQSLSTTRENITKQLTEITNELEERYSDTLGKIPPRIKSEFEKLQESVKQNKVVMRFYKRYPNSKSKSILRLKDVISKLSRRDD